MPGGELPVERGDEVVRVARRLSLDSFAHAFATQDWHPPGHISFASTHGAPPFSTVRLAYGEQVLWPDHAVIGTPGAALHPALPLDRVDAVFRKGFRPGIDSYSAFRDNDRVSPTGLGGWIAERGFSRVFLCGLALDFCVFWSAQDARELGYEVFVIDDACRAIAAPAPDGGTTQDAAYRAMRDAGVQIIGSGDLARPTAASAASAAATPVS
jgi:nicotinamidase/pyrazinamidase